MKEPDELILDDLFIEQTELNAFDLLSLQVQCIRDELTRLRESLPGQSKETIAEELTRIIRDYC